MKGPCMALCALLLAAGGAGARAAEPVSAGDVEALLAAGDVVTLVDVRPFEAFQAGSLPNAVSMSAVEAAQRPLRGRVVFFDCGTGANVARASAERYRALRGTAAGSAAWLRGGYAGWSQGHRTTHEPGGLKPLFTRYVSYQTLTECMGEDRDEIVLVDLRPAPAPRPAGTPPRAVASADGTDGTDTADGTGETPVDLATEFPGFGITRELPSRSVAPPPPPGGMVAAASTDAAADTPLYVLIDRGDGAAEEVARQLRHEGLHRVVVLAGGEPIIRRRGEPGLIRRGPGTGLARDVRDAAGTTGALVREELP